VCRVFFIFKESFPGFARMRFSHEDWISLKGEGHYEVNPDTLRWLIEAWRGLRQNPESCLDLDLLAFLDRAQTEAAQGH